MTAAGSIFVRHSVAAPQSGAATPLQLDWTRLLLSTIAFARAQLRRHYWRGSLTGVLPHGFDASSVAAQALLQFLLRTQVEPSADVRAVTWSVRRNVLREVNRLRHLKENRVVRNEADLALVTQEDGPPLSPVDLIPDPYPAPDAVLVQAESEAECTHFARAFASSLSGESQLQALWLNLLAGTSRPRDLATALHLPVRSAENLQKRLRRRWLTFRLAVP